MSPGDPDSSRAPSRWTAATPHEIVLRARRWIDSDPLRQLVHVLGGPSDVRSPGTLACWSSRTLDTRCGTERRDSEPVAFPRPWIDALLEAAAPLGLMQTTTPSRDAYGATLLLGGATTGNRLRTQLLARAMRAGLDPGVVVAVTADRPLTAHERASDPDSIADAAEWEHLLRCVGEQLGPLSELRDERGAIGASAWQDRVLRAPDARIVRLLVAPPRAGRKRAGTADGIAFALERLSRDERRDILLVTSSIYAPYQFFVAAPMLVGAGVRSVELIGTPTATDGPRELLAQRVAQEIHAAIEAAASLLACSWCPGGA